MRGIFDEKNSGIIDGGTFLGNRNITRYEMAQMVAKALARAPQGGTDRAALDRLAAEFADELNNLGVRVSELEKYADRVKINGKIEYTYHSYRPESYNSGVKQRHRVNDDTFVFRFEQTATVNDHRFLRGVSTARTT